MAAAVHVMPWREFVYLIRDRNDTFEFGGERELSIFPAVKEGLDAQEIPGGQELIAICDYEGENGVGQLVEHLLAVPFIESKEQTFLPERAIRDPMPLSQFSPISHLTVVTDSKVISTGARHRNRDIARSRGPVGLEIVLSHDEPFGIEDSADTRSPVADLLQHGFNGLTIHLSTSDDQATHRKLQMLKSSTLKPSR
jgi:hypothetical protein